jgi:hypothetical protein
MSPLEYDMEANREKIICPNCGTEIDVNEILYHQLEDQITSQFEAQLKAERAAIGEKERAIEATRAELASKLENSQAAIDQAVRQQTKKLREQLAAEAAEAAREEQADTIEQLRKELDEKSQRVKDLNKTRAEVEKLKREKEELADEIQAKAEAKLTEALRKERERIQKTESEKNELKLKESHDLVESLRKQLAEAQRRAEQGSMQSQGEVQELAIEQWLRDHFPMDRIEEIKKGAQGADCLQIVNTRSHEGCGSIYYESKRTKSFQPSWVAKFKDDIREKGADLGVLVTASMPPDMDRMGLVDGVWVCSYEEFKGLSAVLRQSIIQVHQAGKTQENKGGKMEMLYDYLTGSEFRQQVEAIVEGFTQMQSDLETEKRSMQAQWKKREKQLEKVILSTTYMYSSVKGIAGSAVGDVRLLELPGEED